MARELILAKTAEEAVTAKTGSAVFVAGGTEVNRLGSEKAEKADILISLKKCSGLSDITASVSVANYVSFLLTIFVIMGVIFELPVVCVTLTSLGLLKVEWMVKARKFAIIIIFLVAAIVTPPDVVSQCMVAVPMLGLYQFSILICKLISRRKKNREEEDPEEQG